MKIDIGLYVTVLLALATGSGLLAQASTPSILNRRITIDQRFKAGTWEAVYYLADQGVPIGFEAKAHMNVDTDPRVVLKSGTLEDVLDSIVRQDVFYTWTERDGVINVFPIMDRNPKSLAFLQTRIGEVSIRKGDKKASVVELISRMYKGNQSSDAIFLSVIGSRNELGLPDTYSDEIRLPRLEMRSVLNELVKKQAYRPIWTLTHWPKTSGLTVVF